MKNEIQTQYFVKADHGFTSYKASHRLRTNTKKQIIIRKILLLNIQNKLQVEG